MSIFIAQTQTTRWDNSTRHVYCRRRLQSAHDTAAVSLRMHGKGECINGRAAFNTAHGGIINCSLVRVIRHSCFLFYEKPLACRTRHCRANKYLNQTTRSFPLVFRELFEEITGLFFYSGKELRVWRSRADVMILVKLKQETDGSITTQPSELQRVLLCCLGLLEMNVETMQSWFEKGCF